MGQSQVSYRIFRAGSFTSWDALFSEVAAFASDLGADKVISISHSEDDNDAIVTVWFRE